jgi:hypothetical protein
VSVVDAPVRLGIDLLNCHDAFACSEFATPLYEQMSSGKYDVCATMPLPSSREAWEAEHRTARKRAWKASSLGYVFGPLEREKWEIDIDRINSSRDYRQGRPMAGSYREPSSFDPLPDFPCALHAIRCYGVWSGSGHLVAYLVMYRAGDLALVSQVLGHGDHEDNGIMHLLHRDALVAEGAVAPGVAVYNRFDSGTPGLRQFKHWIGYEETAVEWLP